MKGFPRTKDESAGLLPHHPAFDGVLIFGTLVLALSLGALASVSSTALLVVVLVDIWLFANPHVVATFTRITSSAADVRRHRFLIFGLPALVLAGVVLVALAYEVAGLFTLYFIAQCYHVTRQSFGIARSYRRASGTPFATDGSADALIYMVPAWGVLARCAQAPREFLGYPIGLPVVSTGFVDAVGLVTIACGAWWLQRRFRAAMTGTLDWRHDTFVASHVCVSLAAYVWIADITLGWLVLNIWHNAQYLLFVWVQNIRRVQQDEGNASAGAKFTDLRRNAVRYGGVCLLVGAALFQILDWMGSQLLWLGLPTVLIAHFTLNFHHYLVDGVIWKRRSAVRARPWPTGAKQTPLDTHGKIN
ncbi:hypothetical protein [Variovorax sp. OV329]|uniref:hypothetical protein n=1 Tax=Variovorax sp. OV329 TaxID=1882825 RepID=UPI0008EBBC47|nr:hypothetical protein [Variovorax sp. OV329]SFN18547.1 hypothetical protein SAMN05444747_11756 [Variovorax sp. OV329]